MRPIALLALLTLHCNQTLAQTSGTPASAARGIDDERLAQLTAQIAELKEKVSRLSRDAEAAEAAAKAADARAAALEQAAEPAQRLAVGRYIDAAETIELLYVLSRMSPDERAAVRPLIVRVEDGEMLSEDEWTLLSGALKRASSFSPLWMDGAMDMRRRSEGMPQELARFDAARKYLATDDRDERAAIQFEAHLDTIVFAEAIQPVSTPLAHKVEGNQLIMLESCSRSDSRANNLLAQFVRVTRDARGFDGGGSGGAQTYSRLDDAEPFHVMFPAHSQTTHVTTIMSIIEASMRRPTGSEWQKAAMEPVFSAPKDASSTEPNYEKWWFVGFAERRE